MNWPDIQRDDYLRMLDRHRPLSASISEFICANRVRSVIEAGCGIGELSYSVDAYTGIDLNARILNENQQFCENGTWLNDDWLTMDLSSMRADMFVATSLIEHCESFETFLERVSRLYVKYAVITFHKGLRDTATIRMDRSNSFFDNLYCQADVEKWLRENLKADWYIFRLPLSRSKRMRSVRWDSVLVIDWTKNARMEMWAKRNVAS